MSSPQMVVEYTRVSDDAAILCRRRDFPRAVNVLQRRAPDRRRWRQAFRTVAVSADKALEGNRRQWMEGALREVVTAMGDRRLAQELTLDVAACDAVLDLGDVLPAWSARDLWRFADSVVLPMEYLAQVTTLPRAIDARIDTARVVLDCRRTADAHRRIALELSTGLSPDALLDGPAAHLGAAERARATQVRAQEDAARRWRALSQQLLEGTPR
jgi:hypothetical protein